MTTFPADNTLALRTNFNFNNDNLVEYIISLIIITRLFNLMSFQGFKKKY